MKRLVGGLIIAIMITSGWPMAKPHHGVAKAQEQAQAGHIFFQKLSQIGHLARQEKWRQAAEVTSSLRQAYQKRKWKIQLLGDEGEYEGVDEELDKLAAAVASKNDTQTRLEIASVRSLFENIYSL